MKRNDVSAVVATRNSAGFLAEALESIRAQDAVGIEILVVDAGSTDGTVDIARRYGARIVEQRQGRLGAAWNLGIKAASSPFVGFLDSDDRWAPATMSARIDALVLTGAPIAVGRVAMFLEPGCDVPPGLNPGLIGREMPSSIPGTMLVRRELFDRLGDFDDGYTTASDVEWIGRALARGCEFAPVDALVLEKRVHTGNLSLNTQTISSELLSALRRKITLTRT